MLKIEQLVYFTEAIRLGTITKAAEHLHISPTSISRALSELEDEFDIKLIVRDRTGVRLTKEGEKILESVYKILESIDNLYTNINEQKIQNDSLYINSIAMMSSTIMPAVLAKFRNTFPNIKLTIASTESSQQIVENLSADDLTDIGIMIGSDDADIFQKYSLNAEKLFYNPLRAILPKALYEKYPNGILCKELLEYDLIGYEKDSIVFKKFLQILSEIKEPDIILSTNNSPLVKKLVAQSTSTIGFLSELSIRYSFSPDEEIPIPVPILDLDDTYFAVYAVYKKGRLLSTNAINFLDIFQTELKENGFNTNI